jgi:hypothetical protein
MPDRTKDERRRVVVAFRLHGVGCHVCGRPATHWASGVTLPCGCAQSGHLRADHPAIDSHRAVAS